MASWCPGVGVPSRKRRTIIQRYHRLEDLPIHRERGICGGRFEPSVAVTSNMDMDETALRARRRLEQKLGYFPSSRLSNPEKRDGRDCCTHATRSTAKISTSLNTDIKRRPWPFQSKSSKSYKEVVCAVCLEEFGAEQEVMDLSCSHKYHSKCLVPWLASHPHCPYCRNPV